MSFGLGGCGDFVSLVSQCRNIVNTTAASNGRSDNVIRRWIRRDVRPIVMMFCREVVGSERY